MSESEPLKEPEEGESSQEVAKLVDKVTRAKNRLTVVHQVNHVAQGFPGKTMVLAFDRELEVEEEAYERNMCKATEEWQEIDLGFLKGKSLSYVFIRNNVGQNLQVNPSLEEKEKIAKKILEVVIGFKPLSLYSWLVPPGECFGGCPSSRSVWVRCLSGEARYSLFVAPG
jgi:hypothetical protein